MIKYLKKYWYFGLLSPLFMVGEVLMDLIQPTLMSTIVDDGVLGLSSGGTGDLNIIISTGLKMILCVVAGGICGVLSGVFCNLCAQNFSNDLRKDLFSKIMSFSFEQTDKFSTGSLVTRVTSDITQVQNTVSMCLRGFVRNVIFFVGGIICMLSLNLSFGIVLACALPILAVFVIIFLLKANPLFTILQRMLDKVNSVMQENVAGSRVVKAFVKEDYENERFGEANDDLVSTQLRVLILFSYMQPIMSIVMNLSVVAIIYIGGITVKAGTTTPGNIMAAITYVSQILNGIMMMANFFQTLSRGNASAKRLNEVLTCDPAIKGKEFTAYSDVNDKNFTDDKDVKKKHFTEINHEKGTVEFKNVSFTYPNGSGEPVLSNINFKINSGETIGILGVTGCGKTTLVNMIPRFYDATSGEVFVDGINVKDWNLIELRSAVAVALQKSELLSDTIKGNILWGNPDATDEEVKNAAQIAQASEFIEQSSDGYDTMVAEMGMSLSGGQKQRIAISRAVLKKSEILIFDDATSALDLKTEANLYAALNETASDVTKIIIAQRIASVRNADKIIVIDAGTVIAFDTHDRLMESCNVYRDIYNSQLKGGSIDG